MHLRLPLPSTCFPMPTEGLAEFFFGCRRHLSHPVERISQLMRCNQETDVSGPDREATGRQAHDTQSSSRRFAGAINLLNSIIA